MARCGEAEEFQVTTSYWCWTWHGPWRCKRTETKTLYIYDFAIVRRRDRWFTATHSACCAFLFFVGRLVQYYAQQHRLPPRPAEGVSRSTV